MLKQFFASSKKALAWFDQNILLILASFLIAFIPLWPKIPLFSPIEQYIVRVRMEDVFILMTAGIWGIQFLRGKITWPSPFWKLVTAYAIAGFLSVASGMFLIQTIPLQPLHVGKSVLHYFRYLEYFSLLFIVFSAIKTKKHVAIVLAVLSFTVLAISVYGFGQKYYYWPVYSTMNREFSKGVRLYLTEHARVQSTFGGHYDLAAYLVIALPILLALALTTEKKYLKIGLHIAHWSGLWLMVVCASRTSFVAYLVGMSLVVGLVGLQKSTWGQKIWFAFSREVVCLVAVGVIMVFFGEDMYERFLQVLGGYPKVSDAYHEINKKRKDFVNTTIAVVLRLPEAKKPENGISTEDAENLILVPSDQRPIPNKPSDVYVDVPDLVEVATISASGAATTILVDNGPRVYSENAKQHGLSLAIRLDTLWPQAIKGFMRNPILGSGYATLNKSSVDQFTEAESTDNNFLRTLGETGLLGFLTFYGTVVVAMIVAARNIVTKDVIKRGLCIGFLGGSLGLLINAAYIDVFAASKVALTYWGLVGLVIGYIWLDRSPGVTADTLQSTESLAAALAQKATGTKKRSRK